MLFLRTALNFREARAGGGAARASAGLPQWKVGKGIRAKAGPAGAF